MKLNGDVIAVAGEVLIFGEDGEVVLDSAGADEKIVIGPLNALAPT